MSIPINRNAIYQVDCLALLEQIESQRVMVVYIDASLKPLAEKLKKNEVGERASLQQHLLFLSKVLHQTRRILTEDGNLFFHSEHYLAGYVRVILDEIFGSRNFRTDIIWRNQSRQRYSLGLRTEHDTIFHYSKSDAFVYNPQFRRLSQEEMHSQYNKSDEHGSFRLVNITSPISEPTRQFEWKGLIPPKGSSWQYSQEQLDELDKLGRIYLRSKSRPPALKNYLHEEAKVEVGSIWNDISPLAARSRESLKFPTQKPLALLDRIIQIGSNPGDIVLDPFCGSGTTLVAAQLIDRRWLGSDISFEAYSLSVERLERRFGLRPGIDFNIGENATLKEFSPINSSFDRISKNLENHAQTTEIRLVHKTSVVLPNSMVDNSAASETT